MYIHIYIYIYTRPNAAFGGGLATDGASRRCLRGGASGWRYHAVAEFFYRIGLILSWELKVDDASVGL